MRLFLYQISNILVRNTLKHHQRLKSRKLIGRLFKEGKAVSAFPLRAVYLFLPDGDRKLQAGFTVSTRNFKRAVDRNRIKRCMREAYRINKSVLEEQIKSSNTGLIVFFIFTGKELPHIDLLKQKTRFLMDQLSDIQRQSPL